MKVLHCYRTFFPDSQGGGEEAIRQIALSTRAQGVQNTIFALSVNPNPSLIERAEGTVVRSKSWAAPASCDLGLVGAFSTFSRLAKNADVIHFHFPWPFADLLRQFSAATRKPAVMTYHSDIIRQRMLAYVYRPFMAATLRSMDAVVATSPAYGKTSVVLGEHVPPQRLRVIPLGIVEESCRESIHAAQAVCVREKYGLEPNGYFFSLGVLRYYKGLHILIKAASAVDCPVVIAGDGPMRRELQQLAAESHNANVKFLGRVSNAEKFALMAGCRAFVLSSHLRSEAFGMVLVEASLMGRPMVSCEIGTGTSYVNLADETGLVIPPEDSGALARALNRLIADDAFAARSGRAARLRYESLFSGTALGQAYAGLYHDVLSHG